MSLSAARLLLQRAAPVGSAQAWRRGSPALALKSAQSLRAFSDRGAPPPSDNAPARGAPPPRSWSRTTGTRWWTQKPKVRTTTTP